MQALQDRYGRRFPYLRLSITDVCNFRCQYCLPNGYQKTGQKSFLTLNEIKNLVSGFADLGTTKVRLTGGEPTLRQDFFAIIDTITKIQGIEKVVLTTNGYKLKEKAAAYVAAGIQAITVSIDSLNSETFTQATGKPWLREILAGIDDLLATGMPTVKINAVLLKNINAHQLSAFLEFVKHKPLTVRFIELMETGDHAQFFIQEHIDSEQLKQELLSMGWQPLPRQTDSGPAIEYAHPKYLGKVGIIAPYSTGFCDTCNRLRVTAQGELRLCLFAKQGYSLRPLLQNVEQRQELKERLTDLLALKEKSHFLHQGDTGITPHLASIGG